MFLACSPSHSKVAWLQVSPMLWPTKTMSSVCCTSKAAALSGQMKWSYHGSLSTRETASLLTWGRYFHALDTRILRLNCYFYTHKLLLCFSLTHTRTSTTGPAARATALKGWRPPSWPLISVTTSAKAGLKCIWSIDEGKEPAEVIDVIAGFHLPKGLLVLKGQV